MKTRNLQKGLDMEAILSFERFCAIEPSVLLSVIRPSVAVNFSHFRLLLCNHWTEFDETCQEAGIQRLVFLCLSENIDGCPGVWFA